ncbi:MAG: DUF2256 domain-containing protein [Myxococcales bacterium]|nr:DUF2256 domain-containing protein [Polyangiaceae bacterium]MDW8249424.1 DUF2256 domain-containing protein [Myxococcales bacterium]
MPYRRTAIGGGNFGTTLHKQENRSHQPREKCAACGRPFAWRKKWQRCWEQVKYCSQAC